MERKKKDVLIGLMWSCCGVLICLVIGLPCLLKSCNSWCCPLSTFQTATVSLSNYQKENCSSCCRSENGDGNCIVFGECDCSYFITQFEHSGKQCALRTNKFYTPGSKANIIVDASGDCSEESRTLSNISYVGIVFLILAFLFGIGACVELWGMSKY
jgi:hypothetical protein